MAHEYRLTMSQELSYLELDALAWRVHEAGYTSGDNFIFKLAQEQEKYLHSEEHREQQLLKRIKEAEVESKPEPKPRRGTVDKERTKTTKTVYFAVGFTLACVIRLAAEALYKILK